MQTQAYEDESSPTQKEVDLGAEPFSPSFWFRLRTGVTLGCFPNHERNLLGWMGTKNRSLTHPVVPYLPLVPSIQHTCCGPPSPALEAGPGQHTVSCGGHGQPSGCNPDIFQVMRETETWTCKGPSNDLVVTPAGVLLPACGCGSSGLMCWGADSLYLQNGALLASGWAVSQNQWSVLC